MSYMVSARYQLTLTAALPTPKTPTVSLIGVSAHAATSGRAATSGITRAQPRPGCAH